MSELFSQLGISLPALLAQGFNFLVVLVVLTFFVYRPLAKIVDERHRRIEDGLKHAKQADLLLAEIGEKEKHVLSEAEKIALSVIKEAEGKADERVKELVTEGEKKAAAIIKESRTLGERRAAEEWVSLEREAASFIKVAIAKTVELDPKHVDEKLIERAVLVLRRARA